MNFVDPSGHSVILILGLFGIVAGLTYGAYTDYNDDNSINGSIGWQGYLGYGIKGGAIGLAFGLGIHYLGSAISYIGGALSSFGAPNALAVAGGGTASIASAGILGAMLAAGALVGFAKGFGPRMGHNQHEKQQWDEAMRRLGIKDKDLIRRLHNEKNQYPYQDTLKGLMEVLRKILAEWGK